LEEAVTDAAAPEPRGHQDRHRAILRTAARVICQKSYEGASIQDIAEACGLTKAGLYHHIRSKEHLLLEIMHYGMDVFEEHIMGPVAPIADPVERLKAYMAKNIEVMTQEWTQEIIIVVHEHNNTLTGEARVQVNARKKRYVRFLEDSFQEAMRTGQIRSVHPKVAAFSFLGMVLWTYKWYRPDGGALTPAELAREMQEVFFGGLERRPAAPRPSPASRSAGRSEPKASAKAGSRKNKGSRGR
jgi:TetR/AcrR family transcriptional regulator, cholesterol catabolism regulator